MAYLYPRRYQVVVNIVIIVLVACMVIGGIRRIVGTTTGTRDCCSGDRKGGKAFKPVRITDKDESHYPYGVDLQIAGMSCKSCASHVARALDSVDGTWATVDLASRTAHVRSKRPIEMDAYRAAVSEAGYRVIT